MQKKHAGFTLLELAVVLVIIALISGSVVVGRSLIRNAEVREVIGEFDRYQKAIVTFRDKYNYLPGDFVSATTLWDSDPAICPSGNQTPKHETCNGDGDSLVGAMLDANAGTFNSANKESLMVWQHLANAGLIEGLYSGGASTLGTLSADRGVNAPASKLSNGTWMMHYYLQLTDQAKMWSGNYGHVLFFGSKDMNLASHTQAPILTDKEAYEIDIKMDDGLPASGNIRSWRPGAWTVSCTQGASAAASTYLTTGTAAACAPLFLLGF